MEHWSEALDFLTFSSDNPCGFEGFHSLGNLIAANCQTVPKIMGIYIVLGEKGFFPGMAALNPAYAKCKIIPKNLEALQARWIEESSILYIGKAGGRLSPGANLRTRINEYVKWGRQMRNCHRGGRDIWQLAGACGLKMAWRALSEEEPAAVETRLLKKFKNQFGNYPFANHKC